MVQKAFVAKQRLKEVNLFQCHDFSLRLCHPAEEYLKIIFYYVCKVDNNIVGFLQQLMLLSDFRDIIEGFLSARLYMNI